MSRNVINEEIYDISNLGSHLGSHLRKGMDSLTIADPGRLRVPFGGVYGGAGLVSKTPRRQSWMTVSSGDIPRERPDLDPETAGIVTETPKQPPTSQTIPLSSHAVLAVDATGRSYRFLEIHGCFLAAGYAVFGLGLALCNLLAPQHTSKVCTAVSPLPFLCLLLQALSFIDLKREQCDSQENQSRPGRLWPLGPGCLILSACALPSACIFWSLSTAIPLVLVLSISVFYCMRRRGVLACASLSSVCLSLIVALPAPIQILEPMWGMTVGLFFVCVLCFLAGLGSGGLVFHIR